MADQSEFKISQRQAKILAAIVKDYCETNTPVSSKDLVNKYGFAFSAATIRNEMQALEKSGLIMHPHTSSGRIPTDDGFRYFINQLMEHVRLSAREQEALRTEVIKLQMVNAEIGRRLTKLLAAHTQQASFAIFPQETSAVGISNLLDSGQIPSEDAKEIARFFDNIDEYAEQMVAEYGNKKPHAFIGRELKLSKHSDYSMIVSGVQLPEGKKGVIGLIGPKSMKYQKHLSLMEYITKLFGGGGAVILLIILTSKHL